MDGSPSPLPAATSHGVITAYHHPGFAAPLGDHVMPMRKFQLVADALAGRAGVKVEAPAPIAVDDLLRVHTAAYVDAVRTGEPRELAESQKFPWSPALWPSVLLTNGGLLAAATRALAVLDLDLHYGNGTASLCATRPWLTNCSIYGNDYFQNKPYRDVEIRRHEDGPNHVSFALPNGSGRAVLFETLERGIAALLAAGRPDLVLYQAGADPYREDPYSPLDLDHDDLRERDRLVFAWARKQGLPIAWVLAGGYTPDVSKVVDVHVGTFDAAQSAYR